MKTLENSAITSLLIQLDKKVAGVPSDNEESRTSEIAEIVAEQTERIIDGSEQAKKLFNAEKKMISERGDDISEYLVRNSISVKEVLDAYYSGVVDRNNYRRLSENYSISEMMLMLGTFMHLMEVRTSGLTEMKKRSMQIKIGKLMKRFTRQKLEESKQEELEFLETMVVTTQASEKRMLEYMKDQTSIIMKSILERMGSNLGLVTRRQLSEICLASHELCTTANTMVDYFEARAEQVPAVCSDVALFDSCGERSPKLYSILEPQTQAERGWQKKTK